MLFHLNHASIFSQLQYTFIYLSFTGIFFSFFLSIPARRGTFPRVARAVVISLLTLMLGHLQHFLTTLALATDPPPTNGRDYRSFVTTKSFKRNAPTPSGLIGNIAAAVAQYRFALAIYLVLIDSRHKVDGYIVSPPFHIPRLPKKTEEGDVFPRSDRVITNSPAFILCAAPAIDWNCSRYRSKKVRESGLIRKGRRLSMVSARLSGYKLSIL